MRAWPAAAGSRPRGTDGCRTWLSILDQTQPEEPVEQNVAAQISTRCTVNRCSIRIVPEMSPAQPTLLPAADLHHRSRLLLVMDSEAGEESRYPFEAEPCRLGAKSEVPVEGVLQTFVERSQLLPYTAPPEHGLLRDIVRPFEGLPIVRRQHPPTDFRAVLIDENPMTIDDIDFWLGQEGLRHIGERAGEQDVVAVEIGHDLAVGPREAPIDGACLAGIPLAPPNDLIAVGFEQLLRSVHRTAVLNDIGEVRILLREHAVDRRSQVTHVVVGRRNDSDARRLLRCRLCLV